jgi:hypothetical protein
MYIDTARTEQILEVHIICSDPIEPTYTGWLCISLYLPGYKGRIGEIKWYIWVAKLISRSRAITFVENPVWVDSLPVSQIVGWTPNKKGATITMKEDIVTKENVWIARAKSIDSVDISCPYRIVIPGDSGGIVYIVVKILKEMNIVPGINKRTYSNYITRNGPRY